MASDTLIVHGVEYEVTTLKVDNWQAGGRDKLDYHFKNTKRKQPLVTEIVVHETVTRSALDTLRVLQPACGDNPGGRGLGVHFIVDADGTVYQHGDLADDEMWHATVHNGPSFGIEVVNPYDPRYLSKTAPWKDVIDAPWSVTGKYVVPTPEESEATAGILAWATMHCPAPEIQVPLKWIGLKDGKMALGRVPGANKPSPGIYAHYYFEHGDGAWLVLYCWMRIVAGLDAETAYKECLARTTGVYGAADVSDLIPAPISGDEGETG